jgi:hypothetical protein
MSRRHVAPGVIPIRKQVSSNGSLVRNGLGQDTLLYSVPKVAELFSISKKSVHRLLKRGLLQSSNALRHKMITRASIEKFMSNTSNGGTI